MVALYPQLLSAQYYAELKRKIALPITEPFKYKKTEIPINNLEFKRIASLINSSGYWQMPFYVDCPVFYTDGHDYILEANSTYKYNLVMVGGCPENISKAKQLTRACNELIKLAGLEKEIHLIWNNDNTSS